MVFVKASRNLTGTLTKRNRVCILHITTKYARDPSVVVRSWKRFFKMSNVVQEAPEAPRGERVGRNEKLF